MTKKFLPQNQTVTTPASGINTVPASVITITASGSGYDGSYTKLPSVISLLHALLNSKFEFILGGSRAMYKRGAAVSILEDTDYDFYATYTVEIEEFLVLNNFRRCAARIEYLDTEVVAIYKSKHIDVVLRKDAKFYKSVFDNIKTDLYVKHLWKRNPECDRSKITLLFNEMFKIAHQKRTKATINKSRESQQVFSDIHINRIC